MLALLARFFFLLHLFFLTLHGAESYLEALKCHLKGPESLEFIGGGFHREVYKIKNTDFVLKAPNSHHKKMLFLFLPMIQSEWIAYEISQRMHFDVVPFFHYIVPGSEEEMLISQRCPTLLGPLVLQSNITPTEATLDVQHAHKVILYNWITGRYDTKRENSVVDAEGRVWEVDNELGGADLTRLLTFDEDIDHRLHWLLYEKKIQEPLSEWLLDWVLDLPEIELDKTHLMEGFKENRVLFRERWLHANLNLVKTAICYLRNAGGPITFDRLRQIIAKPNIAKRATEEYQVAKCHK
jgi:hypothetical protein